MILSNLSTVITQPPILLAQINVGELISQVLQDSRSFVYAIFILIVGWIVAWGVAGIIRNLLKRTEIDNRIATWLTGQQGDEPIPIEKWTADVVYWLILLFVIVAALQRLQLEAVSEPLNTLLNEITGFLPQIGAAVILLGAAWLLATLVRILVVRVLRTFDIDQRFGEQLGTTESELTLSETIGNTLYWFIFLLFLPSILSTLQLEGTLRPVQELVNRILSILPNILAAFLIVFIGWLIAQVVRRVVTNLLASTGSDQLGTRLGLSGTGETQSLSWIIGTLVYVLILIPVAIAGLEALKIEAISEPAIAMLDQILNAFPKIFTAALVLIISYFLAQYVCEFVSNILSNVGFDNLFTWLGLQQPQDEQEAETVLTQQTQQRAAESPIQQRTPSELMGIITLVGIMLFATLAAVDILAIPALTDLVSGIIFVSGKILAGLIVFAVGLYFANLAFNLILSSGIQQSRLLGQTARIVIIAFSLAIGLGQIGIAPNIINLAFGLLLGSIAVAIALAFGLGSRDIAAEQVREWLNNFKSSNDD
ncbi:MAG: mechanosensitive ion channel [Halothece sp. Uz-M2-17]|nr:mechanosensitive ion channel [Halothece sp. Uz-M2-17]